MKKIFSIILILIFFVSCGDPASPAEGEPSGDDSRAKITMEMDENLILTLSVVNFSEAMNFLSFTLAYDYTRFIASIVPGTGDFTLNYPSPTLPKPENDEYLPFSFSGISGDGELTKVKFDLTGSSYDGTTIYIEAPILMIDSNNNPFELNSEEFYAQQVCYINQHPTNGVTYDDYSWVNSFCLPIQNDWR